MQPQTKQTTPTKDRSYQFSLVQAALIIISWLMIASAGPEYTASGTFFGFGGMFLALIAFVTAPVSLIVFLVYTIKRQSYKNPNSYFVVSILCQILNIAYLIVASRSVAMLLSWNS